MQARKTSGQQRTSLLSALRNGLTAFAQSLAQPSPKQVRKQLTEFMQEHQVYAQKDIQDWIDALNMARDVYFPRRKELIDIYEYIMRDPHLSAVIESRKMQVKANRFRLLDANGEESEATELLRTGWFFGTTDIPGFLDFVMDTLFWGPTLINFKGYGPDGRFQTVELVDRRHVEPVSGHLLRHPSDFEGQPYREPPFSDWLFEIGQPASLGILWKAAPEVIWKLHSSNAWDQFQNLFGVPMRVAKMYAEDPNIRSDLETQLEEMGTSAWATIPPNVEYEIKESQNHDAWGVFNNHIARRNSEISKLILGQTMTTDDGSSRSQSEVHERVSEDYMLADRMFLRVLMNERVLPFLMRHGYPFEGLTFEWDDTRELDIEKKWEITKGLIENRYDIDESWIEDTFGIPVNGRLNTNPGGFGMPGGDEAGGKKKVPVADLTQFYHTGHQGCNHGPQAALEDFLPEAIITVLSEAFDRMVQRVFDNNRTAPYVDADFYQAHIQALGKAIEKAFDQTDSWPIEEGPDLIMNEHLRNNIHAFSAAKSLETVGALQNELTDEDGTPRRFNEFKKKADELGVDYNRRYLEAEYQHALNASRAASQWAEIQDGREDFEFLRYETAGDKRVRDSHEALDGTVAHIDNPFWQKYMPPNGWGCRCDVIQVSRNQVERQNLPAYGPNKSNELMDKGGKAVPERHRQFFERNWGRERQVYPADHPYFSGKDIYNLKAERDYGMPDYRAMDRGKLPEQELAHDSKGSFDQWFEEQIEQRGRSAEEIKQIYSGYKKKNGPALPLKDYEGRLVHFTERQKTHITEENQDERWRYARTIEQVLINPDEVWDNTEWDSRKGDSVEVAYLKFYKEHPMLVAVSIPNNLDQPIRIRTAYQIQGANQDKVRQTLNKKRKGVLRHRKTPSTE
jgi:SPP1 gp7 family putative phage head morphogenesis protein